MKEIDTNLYIGDDNDCQATRNKGFAVIHACKTCHQKGVHYTGSLRSAHPHYLIYKTTDDLYLNMVDMNRELLPEFTHPIVKSAIAFIMNQIEQKPILIHCNQGLSRSPAIGLLFMARLEKIKSGSYRDAVQEFKEIYPMYSPGKGIDLYLEKNWEDLM